MCVVGVPRETTSAWPPSRLDHLPPFVLAQKATLPLQLLVCTATQFLLGASCTSHLSIEVSPWLGLRSRVPSLGAHRSEQASVCLLPKPTDLGVRLCCSLARDRGAAGRGRRKPPLVPITPSDSSRQGLRSFVRVPSDKARAFRQTGRGCPRQLACHTTAASVCLYFFFLSVVVVFIYVSIRANVVLREHRNETPRRENYAALFLFCTARSTQLCTVW